MKLQQISNYQEPVVLEKKSTLNGRLGVVRIRLLAYRRYCLLELLHSVAVTREALKDGITTRSNDTNEWCAGFHSSHRQARSKVES